MLIEVLLPVERRFSVILDTYSGYAINFASRFFAEAKPVWRRFLKSYGDKTKFVATLRESLYTVE